MLNTHTCNNQSFVLQSCDICQALHVCTHGLALSGRNQLQTSTKTLSPAPYQIGLDHVLDVKTEENTTSQWIHAALKIVWMA